MGYQGHDSWTEWNVSLWLNNDESLYRLAQEFVLRNPDKDKAALALLTELEELGQKYTPDGARYSQSAIRKALRGM